MVSLGSPTSGLRSCVADRLLWHVREFNKARGSIAEYEEMARQRQKDRKKRIKQINTSIRDVEERQTTLTTRLSKTKSPRAQDLIEKEIDRLETERSTLLTALEELEEEAKKI
jgi:predicted  nucleic acid-binding Zn-ribbon protein